MTFTKLVLSAMFVISSSAAYAHNNGVIIFHKDTVDRNSVDQHQMSDLRKEQARGTADDDVDFRKNHLCYEGTSDDVQKLLNKLATNGEETIDSMHVEGSKIMLQGHYNSNQYPYQLEIPACK